MTQLSGLPASLRTATVCALALLAACRDKAAGTGPPPDPARFATLSTAQKCDEVAPRALPCTTELQVEQKLALSGHVTADERAAIERTSAPSRRLPGEDAELHRIACRAPGDSAGAYVEGIVRCWERSSCSAFAACVYSDPRLRIVDK